MQAGDAQRSGSIGLNLAEGQLVFEALAELPFKQVYALIGRLNRMANERLEQGGDLASRQLFQLEAAEFELVLLSLGRMPFNRVSGLLTRLQAETGAAVVAADGGEHG